MIGTGLLGSEVARELIARGHEVRAPALPPLPVGAQTPSEIRLAAWHPCIRSRVGQENTALSLSKDSADVVGMGGVAWRAQGSS